jgi:hypothetical protein
MFQQKSSYSKNKKKLVYHQSKNNKNTKFNKNLLKYQTRYESSKGNYQIDLIFDQKIKEPKLLVLNTSESNPNYFLDLNQEKKQKAITHNKNNIVLKRINLDILEYLCGFLKYKEIIRLFVICSDIHLMIKELISERNLAKRIMVPIFGQEDLSPLFFKKKTTNPSRVKVIYANEKNKYQINCKYHEYWKLKSVYGKIISVIYKPVTIIEIMCSRSDFGTMKYLTF